MNKRWALVVDNDLAVFTYGEEVVFTWNDPPAMPQEVVAMIQQAWLAGRTAGQAVTPEQLRRGREVAYDLEGFLDDLPERTHDR
jgi:hypothetical protein